MTRVWVKLRKSVPKNVQNFSTYKTIYHSVYHGISLSNSNWHSRKMGLFALTRLPPGQTWFVRTWCQCRDENVDDTFLNYFLHLHVCPHINNNDKHVYCFATTTGVHNFVNLHHIEQRSQTHGPRVACGPPKVLVRASALF
jgi:hypothetical protein